MDWTTLLTTLMPIVLELLEECTKPEPAAEAKVFKRLRNPGVAEAWVLRHKLRTSTDLRGRELNQAVGQAMDALSKATDEQLRELISEAKESTNG